MRRILMKRVLILPMILLLMLGIIGCGTNAEDAEGDTAKSESVGSLDGSSDGSSSESADTGASSSSSEHVIKAMFYPFDETSYVMVDTDSKTVFTVTFPEDMEDVNGNTITKDDLTAGNIVEIEGNGIMLQSYPGQYPGVTRITVLEEGDPSDVEQYSDIKEAVYQEPDPADRPELSLSYTTNDAAVSNITSEGSYSWTYTDNDGTEQKEEATLSHILLWEDLIDVRLPYAVDIALQFDKNPDSFTVVRYPVDKRGQTEDVGEEEISVENGEDGPVLEAVEAGYIYQINAVWENGSVEYGFMTV